MKAKFKKDDKVSVLYTPRGYGHSVKLLGIVLRVNKKNGFCVVRTLINEMGCRESELTLVCRAENREDGA